MANSFIKNVKRTVNHWYLQVIIGIIFIITSIWTFRQPEESYLALSIVFSVSFLISGLVESTFAIANRNRMDGWGWSLAFGLLTTIVGLMMINNPGISLLTLPFYVGFILMFRSFGAIGFSLDLKNYGVSDWGLMMFLGILGAILSFIMIWNPVFGGMTIVFWTGILFFLSGIMSIWLGLRMRKLHKSWDSISSELKAKYDQLQNEIRNARGNK